MYAPRHNREDDPVALLAFVRENPFATLVTVGLGGLPRATHLPFVVRGGPDGPLTLIAHLARANPQWEDFSEGKESLSIFQGPHAYISPAHYERPLSVPTWNYIAVHLYGIPRILEAQDEKRRALDLLVAQEEPGFAAQLASYPTEVIDGKLRAIVAFEIPITRVEARYKLSQDRTETERRTIIQSLSRSPAEVDRGIAAAMAERP